MFRIGLKFPCSGLNRVKKHCSRVYLTARYYETHTRVKYEPEGRYGRDIKLISRLSEHKYSTQSSDIQKSSGGGIRTLVFCSLFGTLTLIIYFYNPWEDQFKQASEKFLRDQDELISKIPSSVRRFFVWSDEKKEDAEKAAPSPAFKTLVDKKDPPVNVPYKEIRVAKEKEEKIEVVAAKPLPPPKDVPSETTLTNLVELETSIGEAASKAIAAYQQATAAIQDYKEDVMKLMENTGSSVSGEVWERIKDTSRRRQEALKKAEAHANEALSSLKQMSSRIDEPTFEAPAALKTVAKRNIQKILNDVDNMKKKYDDELKNSNIAERYWKEVKVARENFNDELQILFPNVNINEKRLVIDEEAFDLFVLHMYNKFNYVQKELVKLQTIYESKIKSLMRTAGEDVSQERISALLDLEMDKEKRSLQDEFSKKLLEEQAKFEKDLRHQLKLHSQVHADHLREALAVKDQEFQRSLKRVLSEQAEEMSTRYKAELAVVIGRLRGIDTAFKARLEEEQGAWSVQLLWSACQALARAIKVAPPGMSSDVAVRPLEPEIKAVCKVAPQGDPLVRAAIAGIPEEAAKRGVYPEDTLRERFLKVEKMAKKLALVPEQGASLPIYLLSYLQSFLIIDNVNPISKSEIMDEPFDVKSLNTFDILHRARYWLDRGDFKMTLRYMNLLRGAPRSIARDWMNETRIFLETQQAIDTLLAYAGAIGLVFLGAGDQPPK